MTASRCVCRKPRISRRPRRSPLRPNFGPIFSWRRTNMATEVLMPALSPTMTEGKLAKWLKRPGDEVKSGDVTAEIETDKATMEREAGDEGKLPKILVEEGTEGVPVNTVIAMLGAEGESAAAAPKAEAKPAPAPQAATPAQAKHAPATTQELKEPEWGATKPTTVREALREAMALEMRADKDVFLLGEEVAQYQGAYKISQGLLDEFGPRRVIDTPITEHGFAGMAVGAAMNGLKPIVEFMTFNFAMQAMDQIINSAAKTLYMSGGQMGCPIVFRGPNGAASRVAAQHSQCYASWYAHCPGLKVVAPYFASDCKGLLRAAIRDPNPVIMLENEILYGQTFDCPTDEDFILPLGRAKVEHVGQHVPIVAFSIMVGVAMKAAEALAEQGIEAEVINLRSLRPFDTATVIESVKKTNRIVMVEEGWPFAGIGAEVAMQVIEHAFDWLDAPPVRVHGLDVPLPYAANLEKLALPQPEWVVDAVKKIV